MLEPGEKLTLNAKLRDSYVVMTKENTILGMIEGKQGKYQIDIQNLPKESNSNTFVLQNNLDVPVVVWGKTDNGSWSKRALLKPCYSTTMLISPFSEWLIYDTNKETILGQTLGGKGHTTYSIDTELYNPSKCEEMRLYSAIK